MTSKPSGTPWIAASDGQTRRFAWRHPCRSFGSCGSTCCEYASRCDPSSKSAQVLETATRTSHSHGVTISADRDPPRENRILSPNERVAHGLRGGDGSKPIYSPGVYRASVVEKCPAEAGQRFGGLADERRQDGSALKRSGAGGDPLAIRAKGSRVLSSALTW